MASIDSTKDGLDWSLLAQVNFELATGEPVERSFARCLNACAAALGGGTYAVFLEDGNGHTLSAVAAVGADMEAITTYPLGEGQSLGTWNEGDCNDLFSQVPLLTGAHQRCIPLLYRDMSFGLMTLARVKGSPPLNEEERTFVEATACALATSLTGNIPHEDIMARERLERELQFAHTLQRSFTPRGVPELTNYRIDAHHNASIEMGGDFHDTISLTGGDLALVVGSTSGNGIEAGLNIARTISELRGILACTDNPSKALAILNAQLYEQVKGSLLITIGLAILTPTTGALRCAAAGSTSLCLIDATVTKVEHLEVTSSAPLGILSERSFDTVTATIAPKGSLIIYTDGLLTSPNEAGKNLDRSMLNACLLEEHPAGISGAEALYEHLQDHLDTHPSAGDATIFSIERLG